MGIANLNGMKTLVIDAHGRIVIPKAIRQQLRLHTGSRLTFELQENSLVLCTLDNGPELSDEGGWLVHQGRALTDITTTVDQHRLDRLDDLTS